MLTESQVFRYARGGKVIIGFAVLVCLGASIFALAVATSDSGGVWHFLTGVILLAITIMGIMSTIRFSLTVGPESIIKRTLILQEMRYDDLTKIFVARVDITLFAGRRMLRITQETEKREVILALIAERIAHRKDVTIFGNEDMIRKYFGEHRVPK